jgi:hypothetical protein
VVVEFLGMKEEEEEEGVKNDSPKSALTDEWHSRSKLVRKKKKK